MVPPATVLAKVKSPERVWMVTLPTPVSIGPTSDRDPTFRKLREAGELTLPGTPKVVISVPMVTLPALTISNCPWLAA